MHDDGVLGRQRDQRLLRRGKACGVKHPRADICHLAVPPVIVAAIFCEHHVVKGGSQLFAGHPQQDLRLGEALLYIEVVTMQLKSDRYGRFRLKNRQIAE